MEYLIAYFLFAVTTALTAAVVIMRPVIGQLKHECPLNDVVQSPTIAYITFTLLSTLAAPLVIAACFIPSSNEKFKNTLVESIKGN
jgi:hypothetical protein